MSVIDDRMSVDLITEVMNVMDRHGYVRGDNQHVAQAIGTIIDLARTYEGIQEPPSAYQVPEAPGHADQDAVIVSTNEVKTLLTALDEAAEYKRDRAATCADCTDQSCGTCQWRLQAARDYDQMAAQMLQTAEVARAANSGQPQRVGPPAVRARLRPEADVEAGQ